MKVLLPTEIVNQLIAALRSAGQCEIGGILMGECLAPDYFRVADVTIQFRGGSFASFLRNIRLTFSPLKRFFEKTGYNYQRFNYLGEWHSHPSFTPEPSSPDIQTMREIVEDQRVGATFAVLIIVRLTQDNVLDGTATVFVPGQPYFRGSLVMENPLHE